jgi:hypothetical protein
MKKMCRLFSQQAAKRQAARDSFARYRRWWYVATIVTLTVSGGLSIAAHAAPSIPGVPGVPNINLGNTAATYVGKRAALAAQNAQNAATGGGIPNLIGLAKSSITIPAAINPDGTDVGTIVQNDLQDFNSEGTNFGQCLDYRMFRETQCKCRMPGIPFLNICSTFWEINYRWPVKRYEITREPYQSDRTERTIMATHKTTARNTITDQFLVTVRMKLMKMMLDMVQGKSPNAGGLPSLNGPAQATIKDMLGMKGAEKARDTKAARLASVHTIPTAHRRLCSGLLYQCMINPEIYLGGIPAPLYWHVILPFNVMAIIPGSGYLPPLPFGWSEDILRRNLSHDPMGLVYLLLNPMTFSHAGTLLATQAPSLVDPLICSRASKADYLMSPQKDKSMGTIDLSTLPNKLDMKSATSSGVAALSQAGFSIPGIGSLLGMAGISPCLKWANGPWLPLSLSSNPVDEGQIAAVSALKAIKLNALLSLLNIPPASLNPMEFDDIVSAKEGDDGDFAPGDAFQWTDGDQVGQSQLKCANPTMPLESYGDLNVEEQPAKPLVVTHWKRFNGCLPGFVPCMSSCPDFAAQTMPVPFFVNVENSYTAPDPDRAAVTPG